MKDKNTQKTVHFIKIFDFFRQTQKKNQKNAKKKTLKNQKIVQKTLFYLNTMTMIIL